MLCFYAVLLLNHLLKVISSHIFQRDRRNLSDHWLICIREDVCLLQTDRNTHTRLHAVLF